MLLKCLVCHFGPCQSQFGPCQLFRGYTTVILCSPVGDSWIGPGFRLLLMVMKNDENIFVLVF